MSVNLTLRNGIKITVEHVSVPECNVGDMVLEYGNVFRLTKRFDWGGGEEFGRVTSPCTSFETEVVIRDKTAIPDSYIEGGWVVQGNMNSRVARVLSGL